MLLQLLLRRGHLLMLLRLHLLLTLLLRHHHHWDKAIKSHLSISCIIEHSEELDIIASPTSRIA
jgi:hypothetical protein